MRYIFDTKIIKIEDIKFLLNFSDDKIEVTVFDKEVFEKQAKFDCNKNKKDIVVRKNRKVKLFN